MQPKYLKNTKNGEVFAYSTYLANLPEMVPSELDGSIPADALEEIEESDSKPKKGK